MSARIGDRRFNWFTRFFDVAQGYEPRDIQDRGIMPIVDTIPAAADTVMAVCDWTSGGGSLPNAFWQSMTFEFEDGAYPASAFLPRDRAWKILQLGAYTAGQNFYLNVHPYHSDTTNWSVGTREVVTGPHALGGVYPVDYPDYHGMLLPYGGIIYIRGVAAGGTGYLRCLAIGYDRASGNFPPHS